MQTTKERLIAALQDAEARTLATYQSSWSGLTEDQVEENRDSYGENVLTKGQDNSIWKRIVESIINPFTVILLLIALVSSSSSFSSFSLEGFALSKNCEVTRLLATFLA